MPAPPVAIRQKLLSAPATAAERADHLHRSGVVDRLGPLYSRLGGILEHGLASAHRHVLLVQRGEPDAAVIVRVLLAADPEEPDVEQPHRAREDLLVPEPAVADAGRDLAPQLRQETPEPLHPAELRAVAVLPPERVVEVLLAARRIDPCRLEVAEGILTDPHVAPRRRDRERAHTLERLAIAHCAARFVDVAEPAPPPHASQPRPGAVGAAQTPS